MIYIVNHTSREFAFLPENEYKEFYLSLTRGSGINRRWYKDDDIEAKTICDELYEKIKKMNYRLPSLADYNQMY